MSFILASGDLNLTSKAYRFVVRPLLFVLTALTKTAELQGRKESLQELFQIASRKSCIFP